MRFEQHVERALAALPPEIAGARDDRLAIAEAKPRPQSTLLVPERVELGVQPLQLGSQGRVVAVGEIVPEVGALLTRPLDLVVDLVQGTDGHARENAASSADIPWTEMNVF